MQVHAQGQFLAVELALRGGFIEARVKAATNNGSGAPGGASVATRGRGVPMTATTDVNHDGYPDLILYFRTEDLNFAAGSQNSAGLKRGATGTAMGSAMEAELYGRTYSGTPIRGPDTVRIVPPPKPAAFARAFFIDALFGMP